MAYAMSGLMRGEVGIAVQAWKDRIADRARHEAFTSMVAKSEAEISHVAVREMRAVLWRLVKGETAMLVERWRDNRKAYHLKLVHHAAIMKSRLSTAHLASTGRHSIGSSLLSFVMAGIMRGHIGAVWQAMKKGVAETKRQAAFADLVAKSEAEISHVAVREMRAVLWRLVKGETAMLVERWRDNRKAYHLKLVHHAAIMKSRLSTAHLVSTGRHSIQMGAILLAFKRRNRAASRHTSRERKTRTRTLFN